MNWTKRVQPFRTQVAAEFWASNLPAIELSLHRINCAEWYEAFDLIKKLKVGVPGSAGSQYLEEELNEFFVLRRYLGLLEHYARLWQNISDEKLAESWRSLQDCLDRIRLLRRFGTNQLVKHVSFFEPELVALEGLYPYNIFCSIGIEVSYFKCSICGGDIDGPDCNHLRNELYGGELAVGIASDITAVDHVALVTHPEDKRCVLHIDNDSEDFRLLRFLSKLLTEHNWKPLSFTGLQFSKRLIDNPSYQKVGRNKACYCGSGLKFKDCCIDQEKIEKPHVDIMGGRDIPVHIIYSEAFTENEAYRLDRVIHRQVRP